MARTAWSLTDFSNEEDVKTYYFPINPIEWDEPLRTPTISTSVTTAPLGNVILFQGNDVPAAGRLGGIIRTSQQKDDLVEWFSKRYPIVLKDDIENEWQILVTSFKMSRHKRVSTQYYYRYTVDFVAIL